MSNDTIARTIAAVFRVRAEIAAARRGVADAPYFRHDDLLALCDAAEAGLRCPPREPTQAMIAAGLSHDDVTMIWHAMYDAWTQEQTRGPAADPLSHAWKSGYAQAKEESALEQQFCPHCNPCCGDGNDKCRKPAADPIADLARRLRALRIVDEVHSDNPLGRDAADALERLARENAALRAFYGDQHIRDRLANAEQVETENDALRAIVRAADAMRARWKPWDIYPLEYSMMIAAYDTARAAWRGEV